MLCGLSLAVDVVLLFSFLLLCVDYLPCIGLTLHIKSPCLASPRGQATAAHSPPSHLRASGGHCGPTFFSLVFCVLLFNHPTSSIVVLPAVSPLVIAIALAIVIAIASRHQHIKALTSVDINTLTSSLLPFPSSHAILLAWGHGLSPPSRHLCTLLLGLTGLTPQTIPASVGFALSWSDHRVRSSSGFSGFGDLGRDY